MQPMYPGQPNSPQTELATAIDDTQDSFEVLNGAVLPDAPNLAVIGAGELAETIRYGQKVGNVLSEVERGFQGEAQSWQAGTKTARNFTAYDYDALRGNVEELQDELDNLDLDAANVTLDSPDFTATNVKDGMQELQNNLNAHAEQTALDNVHGINDLINSLGWQKHRITSDNGAHLLNINSGTIIDAIKDIGTVSFYYNTGANDRPSNATGRGFQLVGQQGIGIVLAIDTANNAFWGNYNANHDRINWKPIASSEVEEYPFPLENGFVNYNTVTANYDCKLFRTGNIVTLTFGCSLLEGNIRRAYNIGTVPMGLRPKNHISFPVSVLRVDDPFVAGSILEEHSARCVLYNNGALQPFFVAGSLTVNRIFGSITYEI